MSGKSKDELIKEQNRTIEELKKQLAILSGGPSTLTPSTSRSTPRTVIAVPAAEANGLPATVPGDYGPPTVIIVPPGVGKPPASKSSSASTSASKSKGKPGRPRGPRIPKEDPAPSKVYSTRKRGRSDETSLPVDLPDSVPVAAEASAEVLDLAALLGSASKKAKKPRQPRDEEQPTGPQQHVLVLGSPHTRKIPLRCPQPECNQSDFRAWDRDLLLKHFKKYHVDSHPNPVFNYLCPFDGCDYISFNEPSYGLYTHVKNVHGDYLKEVEKTMKDGGTVEERNLEDFPYDMLPSQMSRTPVPILGVLNMEKSGLKCPLPTCAGGFQIYKSSSIKRLLEHFKKVHSFTHPNPVLVYCCPLADCSYSSDIGNFRVYYHLKAQHPEWVVEQQALAEREKAEKMIAPQINRSMLEENAGEGTSQHSGDGEDNDKDEGPETDVIMMGSRSMVLEPVRCPIRGCPKSASFKATSTSVLKRHFRRFHRRTHPNPSFYFKCPVVGCNYVGSKAPGTNIWRHTKRAHPEMWAAEAQAVARLRKKNDMEDGEDHRDLTELLRLEAITDVLNPYQLVKPTQVRCRYPECTKSKPFSGADKVQIMRHYLNEHPKVNRMQDILVCCPFADCNFEQAWPIQSLYFHVENVHGKAAKEGLEETPTKSLKAIEETRPDGRTPIRIVGRPTQAGEFWCPVPGCGFSHNVLYELKKHMNLAHSETHPNATFIYVCPIQGCSFAKQSNYQALCTHMTREHGLVREKMAKASGKPHQTREEREALIDSDEEVEEVDESEPGVKVIKITRISKKAKAALEAKERKKAARKEARAKAKKASGKKSGRKGKVSVLEEQADEDLLEGEGQEFAGYEGEDMELYQAAQGAEKAEEEGEGEGEDEEQGEMLSEDEEEEEEGDDEE